MLIVTGIIVGLLILNFSLGNKMEEKSHKNLGMEKVPIRSNTM